MVFSNRGYPDPDSNQDDLSPNNEIIMANDTDTEEEDNGIYNGYEPLSMNDVSGVSEEEDDSQEDEEGAVGSSNVQGLPAITKMEDILVKEVWSGAAPPAVDIVMDKSKVDEVKQAMLNITLPASSIPDWASKIPEEQWKEQLLSKLQKRENGK